MSLPPSADVVVVGSGITGAAAAAAAAARGARVVQIDKEQGPAREGSGRAQGSLRVQGRHAAELPLAREALRLWTDAARDHDFELVAGGNLYLATREQELPLLRRLVEDSHRAGLGSVELLDVAQTRDLIPAAAGPLLGAMWSPGDAHCQPTTGTQVFVERAKRAGVHVAYGVKALALDVSNGRIAAVKTTRGSIAAGAVVVAAGVWTGYLTRTAGVPVPIMPVVMSELETAPVEALFTPTLRAFGFGARQRPNGQVVISAGLNAQVAHGLSLADLHDLQLWLPRALSLRKSLRLHIDTRRIREQLRHRSTVGTALVPDTSPEPTADRALVDDSLHRIAKVIPALSTARAARYWGGLVDMTPDGLPIIDGAAGPVGLTVIAGLCGHGFTLGPVLGEIAADLALAGRSDYDLHSFRLSRYAAGPVAQPEMMI